MNKKDGLKICPKCGDYQEYIREEVSFKGIIAFPEKILPQECYCQRKEQEKTEAEDRKKKETALLMEKFKVSEIPPRFLNWNFNTVDDSENKKVCQKYVDCFDINILAGNGLFLIGTKGTGKTTLTVCMLKELIKQGHSALIIGFREVLNRITATYAPNSLKNQRQVMDELLKFDFLVFDDFGREAYTEKQIELAFWVIDELNKNMKCVAITANPEMIARLKDKREFKYAEQFIAILDRLNEMCKTVLKFEGKSFRSE